MYLAKTSNDRLTRKAFKTFITLSSLNKKIRLIDALVNCDCIEIYTVFNEVIVPRICDSLLLQSVSLITSKSLREYDDKLSKTLITHCLLSTLNVIDYKKEICSILIISLGNYNAILGKSWINKHDMLLDMLKDEILFVSERCNYDDDVTFFSKDLIFLFISIESV